MTAISEAPPAMSPTVTEPKEADPFELLGSDRGVTMVGANVGVSVGFID